MFAFHPFIISRTVIINRNKSKNLYNTFLFHFILFFIVFSLSQIIANYWKWWSVHSPASIPINSNLKRELEEERKTNEIPTSIHRSINWWPQIKSRVNFFLLSIRFQAYLSFKLPFIRQIYQSLSMCPSKLLLYWIPTMERKWAATASTGHAPEEGQKKTIFIFENCVRSSSIKKKPKKKYNNQLKCGLCVKSLIELRKWQ